MVSRWGALVAAVALVAAAVVATSGRASRTLDVHVLDGYTATYRVTDLATSEPSVRTETVEISRPYSGRTQTLRDGEVITGKVTNREHEIQLTSGGRRGPDVQFAIVRQPAGPLRDVSYAALRDAVSAGAGRIAGRAIVGGRACTWFAFGAPFPEALATHGRERVDVCVDRSGVLLREVWTIGERVVRETELTEIDAVPPPDERFFDGRDAADLDVRQPEAADILAGQFVVSDRGPLPRPRLGLDPPDGWRRDRSSGVVQASPVDGSATQTSVVSYVRAGEVVIVERSIRHAPPTWADEGARIDAGPGDGRIVFYASHVEIRTITNADGFARILAPSRRVAEAFARALTPPK